MSVVIQSGLQLFVFVYLYLGNDGVLVGEWIVEVISFQKIFGLCGRKHHIVEIRGHVTRRDDKQQTNEQGKIVLLSLWTFGVHISLLKKMFTTFQVS